ncbi:UNVERIFIED_CONTAM: LINE-1 retrotransposable element O protein [Sesamum latifolium]|uniref:LINE-1 retrotransposable element O protein n=1 Tax=Sesamum latifolium TaxID=2727402 RepID=A0AAW2XGX8_9LAMI
MDFFVTGRLLKQVNSTLISLIPKVNNPTVVGEFRPISCCNVLYKIITKILVQRMRGILDMLVSPSQNAFVPGRSIGDNILLAQELYGYNQQRLPPRCALKVDLRKAYDTVEWDFLRAVLTLFGFPEQFIGWIVECVTTPSFSVCLNGSPHGYFRGARGLRQGDPMSPYLFVLVMEVLSLILRQVIDQDGGFSYHWKCGEMQLCQLGFADDLLLFSKADTGSVQVFRHALTVFADLSGLQANLHKSHLILSRSAAPLRDTLLAILDFQEGHLPLGIWVYLLASRLSIADCQPILQKLIVVLVVGMELHCHLLEIEKRLRHFLWKGNTEGGSAKVSWRQVCRPVSEGGLGIRDLQALNKGLMSRHLWRVITADRSSIWVDWIFHYRLRDLSVWTVSDRTGSWGWRKMVRLRDWLRPFVHYKVGDGTSFSLWHDPWHPLGPLISQFPLGPRHTSLPDSALLCTVLMDGAWWPPITIWRDGLHCLWAPLDSFGWLSLGGFLPWINLGLQHFGGRFPFAGLTLLVIQWASVRWRGKHVANASFRALLASLVYHLWLERNRRIFQNTTRSPNEIARIIVSEIRELIICKQLPSTVSTRGLYRLWRIPWPVEGEADT